MKIFLLNLVCTIMLFSCSSQEKEGDTKSNTKNDSISLIIKNNHFKKRLKYQVNYKYNSPKQTLDEEISYDNEGRIKIITKYYSDGVKILSKKEYQYYNDSTIITEDFEKEIFQYDAGHNLVDKVLINFKVGEVQRKKYYYDKNNNCIEIDECIPTGKCVLSKKYEYDINNNLIYSIIYTISTRSNLKTSLNVEIDNYLFDSTVYFYDKNKLIKAIAYNKHLEALKDGYNEMLPSGKRKEKEVSEMLSVVKYTNNSNDLLTEYYEKFDTINDFDNCRKITYKYDGNNNVTEEINIFKQSKFQNGKNNNKKVINRTYAFQKLITEKIIFNNDSTIPTEHFKYEYKR